jgi:hypothetical protein
MTISAKIVIPAKLRTAIKEAGMRCVQFQDQN